MGKAHDAPPGNGTQRPPFNEHEDMPPAYDAPSSSIAKPQALPPRPGQYPPPQTYQQPQHYGAGPAYGAVGGYPGQQGPYMQQQAPFAYPPGYFCQHCRNTGIKYYNGHPCGTCERLFGVQTAHVQHLPHFAGVPMGAPVLPAGDPRLGGRLCGNCKGHGIKQAMFGLVEEQCRVCRGVGRVF